MKKKIMIMLTVISLVAVMSVFCLAGCTKDGKEVEVKDAFDTLTIMHVEELMNGDLDRVATTLTDISPTVVTFDGLDMLHYTDFIFNWNFDVASKYKFTRMTFDVTINNFDYPTARIEHWSFFNTTRVSGEIKISNDCDFIADEPVSVEINFGENGIESGSNEYNKRYFHIRQGDWDETDINQAQRYMNWKIANLKIFGIEK